MGMKFISVSVDSFMNGNGTATMAQLHPKAIQMCFSSFSASLHFGSIQL